MSVRRRRDKWTDLARRHAGQLRGWIGRLASRCWARAVIQLPHSRILAGIGMPLFVLGWVIVPAWKIFEWGFAVQWPNTEVPFSDPRDAAVDSQGRIYVLDLFHARVQGYSPDGEFQRGWFITRRKVHGLRVTADDRVIVCTNQLLTFTCDGELLESRDRPPDDRHGGFESASEANPTGPYAVRRGLVPHVVDSRTGRVAVSQPWWRRLVSAPFPAFLYVAIGVAFLGAAIARGRYEPNGAQPVGRSGS